MVEIDDAVAEVILYFQGIDVGEFDLEGFFVIAEAGEGAECGEAGRDAAGEDEGEVLLAAGEFGDGAGEEV